MRKLLIILWLGLLGPSSVFAAMSHDEAWRFFVKADLAYKDGRYQDAVAEYTAILTSGFESGPLYYNLGNCYFKQGDVGRAILNYERSRRLIPRDGDLRANLQFALSRVKATPISSPQTFLEKILERTSKFLSPGELLWVFLFLLVIAAGLHLGALYLSVRRRVRPWLVTTIVLAGAFLVNFILIIDQQKGAAIVIDETAAKFEPREQATVHFELNPGQEIWIVNSEGIWQKIRRKDGKIGWVEAKKIEKI